jgi:LacI family transcriptional regulator
MIRLLEARAVPYVVTWVLSPELPCIGFDNRAAGARVASHLLDLGHVDIAVIASLSATNDRAAARVAGVRDALASRGHSLPENHVIGGLGSIGEGKTAMRILMAIKEAPTAVICLNDALAFGVILEAKSRGLKIPGDLSIVGFDDADFAAELNPPLTTVRVPAVEIGVAAADYLVAQIEKTPTSRMVEIPANLIIRASSGPVIRNKAAIRKVRNER